MKFMVYLLLVISFVLSLSVGYQFGKINDARKAGRQQTCLAFKAQNDVFIKLIKDGEKATQSLTYYKQHPSELVTAIKGDEHAIVVIRGNLPSYCP